MLGSIRLSCIAKHFKTFSRRQGLTGALLDLFRREYYTLKALDNISLIVNPGEIVGYLGPNGAGKSTTLKIIAGILLPTSGAVEVNGLNPWAQRYEHNHRIGVFFGHRSQLAWNLPVIESFRFLKEIYAISERQYPERLEELVQSLDLKLLLHLPLRELSLGQRTRCELAAVLLHNPAVLLLDEPAIGLDVEIKLKIRNFLKRLNSQCGTTILLASHDLQDVEGLVNRAVVIDQGRIIFDGSLADLRHEYSPYYKRVVLHFREERALAQARQQLKALEFQAMEQSADGLSMTLIFKQALEIHSVLKTLPHEGLRDLAIEDSQIEDVVLEIYRRQA